MFIQNISADGGAGKSILALENIITILKAF